MDIRSPFWIRNEYKLGRTRSATERMSRLGAAANAIGKARRHRETWSGRDATSASSRRAAFNPGDSGFAQCANITRADSGIAGASAALPLFNETFVATAE